ncbi:hypothetical protein H4R24_001980, partial [Coemansia sp. RSA 988]
PMSQLYMTMRGNRESTNTEGYFHPPIRQDMVLDMSVRKLQTIKQTQRTTHRQADLLKTVLVYNIFKAAVGLNLPPNASKGLQAVPQEVDSRAGDCDIAQQQRLDTVRSNSLDVHSSLDMDVDADENGAAAAEQSWFDHCIDNMLTEEEEEDAQLPYCLDTSDEEDDDVCAHDQSTYPVIVTSAVQTTFDSTLTDPDTHNCISLETRHLELENSSDYGSACFLKRSHHSTSAHSLCKLGESDMSQHWMGHFIPQFVTGPNTMWNSARDNPPTHLDIKSSSTFASELLG